MMSDNRDVQSLTAEQLKYIPKILLQKFRNCIDQLWEIVQAYKSRFESSTISSVSEIL